MAKVRPQKKYRVFAVTALISGALLLSFIAWTRRTPLAKHEETATVPTQFFETYQNRYFGYEIRVPKGVEWCFFAGIDDGAGCMQDADAYEDRDELGFSASNGRLVLEIRPDATGLSVQDFVDRSLRITKENSQHLVAPWNVVKEDPWIFAGTPAVSLIVKDAFYESGFSWGNNGLEVNDGQGIGQSRRVDGVLRVVYFRHGDYLFRLEYPPEDKDSAAIVETFRLLEPERES